MTDTDLPTIRKRLTALRREHGQRSPIGNHCYMLMRQLKHFETATGDQLRNLEMNIARSVAAVEKLVGQSPKP